MANKKKNYHADVFITQVEQSVYDDLLRKVEKNKSNSCFHTEEHEILDVLIVVRHKVQFREYHGERRLFWGGYLIEVKEEEEEEEFEYDNCDQDKTLDIIIVSGGGLMNGNAYATVESHNNNPNDELRYYYCEYGKNPSREYIGNKIVYSTKEKHGYEYNFNIIEE